MEGRGKPSLFCVSGIHSESAIEIGKPCLGTELFLGESIDGPDQKVRTVRKLKLSGNCPAQQFSLVIASFSSFVPVDGNRYDKIGIPAENQIRIAGYDSGSKEMRKNSAVVVLVIHHSLVDLLIVEEEG